MPLNVNTVVHIDNIRFGGEKNDVRAAVCELLARAKLASVMVRNEGFGTVYDFLGVLFKHTRYVVTTSLSSKFIRKLSACKNAITFDDFTLRDVLKLFSRLVYGSVILGERLHKY